MCATRDLLRMAILRYTSEYTVVKGCMSVMSVRSDLLNVALSTGTSLHMQVLSGIHHMNGHTNVMYVTRDFVSQAV